MQNNYLFRLFFTTTIFFSFYGGEAQNIYKQISAVRCDSLIDANTENPNFAIIDVRTYGEWVNDHLEGSINRSTRDSDFDQQLDALPKQKIFLLHCQSGGRSAEAFAKMKDLDFAEVYEMQGGMNSWKSNSLPTTSIHAPKLMLVQYSDVLSSVSGIDTIHVTITNRANDLLTFSSVIFNDLHEITNDFDAQKTLTGAEDYTFSVYHNPVYSGDDSTTISLQSNGGDLEVNIVFKNGIIQNIDAEFQENEIVLYPNPAKTFIDVKGIPGFDLKRISIINLNGQTVLNKEVFVTNRIDISDLQNGIYMARIESGTNIYSKKFVVQH